MKVAETTLNEGDTNLSKQYEWLQNGLYGECPASQGGAAEAMICKMPH